MMFPIDVDTLYITDLKKNYLDLSSLQGGYYGDDNIITDFLNTKYNIYAYFRYPRSTQYLEMQIADVSLNDNNTSTSIFLSKGYYNTTFLYNNISIINERTILQSQQLQSQHQILIAKFAIIKQKEQQKLNDWRHHFNINYYFYKQFFGNFIANLYYYGLNVRVNGELSDNINALTKINSKIVFEFWEYYNGNILTDKNKLIYLAKSIGVCLYAFNIIKCLIIDLKIDNVKPDDKQNAVFIDIDLNILPTMKKKSSDGYYGYIYYKDFIFRSILPTYYKKQLFGKLKLNTKETDNLLYSSLNENWQILDRHGIALQKDRKDTVLYDNITNQIFSEWVKTKVSSTKKIDDFLGSPYYINFEPLYDKHNILFIYQLFIELFYKNFSIMGLLRTGKTTTDNLITINDKDKKVYELFETERIIGKNNIATSMSILSFHNLNNTAILRQYMSALDRVIPELDNISLMLGKDVSQYLKRLIYWDKYDVGMLAHAFGDIPQYSMLFKEICDIFGFDMFNTEDMSEIDNMYIIMQHFIHQNIGTIPQAEFPISDDRAVNRERKMIHKNIGNIPTSGGTTPEDYKRILNERFIAEFNKYTSPEVIAEVKRIGGISEITLDNMTYELWAKSRSLQKNRNEPQYKTEEELLYPSPYSTFPSNKLRIAPFLYIPHLVKDDATNEFIVNPDIELIIAEPSRVVDIFRRNKDTYQLFNPYERDIPYAEHINDSLLYRLKRQLTQSEINQIKIILYPERSLITTTDLNIEAFKIELNRFKQSDESKLYKTQTKINQYERPPSEQSILDIEKNISTFRQIFNRLQFTDDKLKDIIAKIQRIDFTQTKPYTDDEINELIEPDKGFEPSNKELTSILLILRTILHFIDIRYDTIPLIIERLQMELTKIKNLTEILDIVLTQIEFTTSKHNELIHRLKFKSVKTDFTEEEIIGIIDKIKSKRAEEQKKAVNREQTIINANKSFGDILDKLRKFDKDMEQKIQEEDKEQIKEKTREKDKPATIFKSVKPFGSWGKKTKSKNPDKDTTYSDRRWSKEKTKERNFARRNKGTYQKYLKYRNKFLKLKNELNI